MTHPAATRIEIFVATDGEVRLETKGLAGPACRQASAFLEQALGQRIAETLTGEFYQQATAAPRLEHRA